MSVSTVGNWTANFLISSSFFLSLTTAITRQGTFWLYAGFGVAALTYFIVRVPETKDRSLEEIERDLGTSGAEAPPATRRPPDPADEGPDQLECGR